MKTLAIFSNYVWCSGDVGKLRPYWNRLETRAVSSADIIWAVRCTKFTGPDVPGVRSGSRSKTRIRFHTRSRPAVTSNPVLLFVWMRKYTFTLKTADIILFFMENLHDSIIFKLQNYVRCRWVIGSKPDFHPGMVTDFNSSSGADCVPLLCILSCALSGGCHTFCW